MDDIKKTYRGAELSEIAAKLPEIGTQDTLAFDAEAEQVSELLRSWYAGDTR